ncbi:MAG: type II secretion system protein [Candidatus Nanogingivalaceae bacterium]|nr:type II secretion system protein [Candidatus Nanogingivalaceae bacterium]
MISSNKTKGFTLVELLIVIVVIAILAAISIAAYNGVSNKARDGERLASARDIINAAAVYNSEKGHWPTIAELGSFNTIKLSDQIKNRLGTTAPSPSDRSKYKYELCGTAPNFTGAKVTYWKEVIDGHETHEKTVNSGSGC